MAMLGADLGHLGEAANMASQAANSAVETGTNAVQSVQTFEGEFTGLAGNVTSTVETTLAALQAVVDSLGSQAAAANWTGANQARSHLTGPVSGNFEAMRAAVLAQQANLDQAMNS